MSSAGPISRGGAPGSGSSAASVTTLGRDPVATDDADAGFSVGDIVVNTATGEQFVCVDAASGAAVWREATSAEELTAHTADTAPHGATSSATADRLVLRDAVGRARFSAPTASEDAARKAETDAVQATLDAHAGDTANPHGVTKAQVGLSEVVNLKHNLSATAAPTAGADSTAGYAVGSHWIDTVASQAYVCVDATTDTAVWVKLTNLSALSEDPAPQLGAGLDAQSQPITSLRTATFAEELDAGNSGTSVTVDWTSAQKQKLTLTGDATVSFTAPAGPCNLVLKLVQDATGGRTITWPASLKWPGGAAPTLTAAAGAVDLVCLYFDGADYHGSFAGDMS